MNNNLIISNYTLQKSQVGEHKYKIVVFKNDKSELTFNVSLQPTGNTDILPTFQPFPIGTPLPTWINDNMNKISDWITQGNSKYRIKSE